MILDFQINEAREIIQIVSQIFLFGINSISNYLKYPFDRLEIFHF